MKDEVTVNIAITTKGFTSVQRTMARSDYDRIARDLDGKPLERAKAIEKIYDVVGPGLIHSDVLIDQVDDFDQVVDGTNE